MFVFIRDAINICLKWCLYFSICICTLRSTRLCLLYYYCLFLSARLLWTFYLNEIVFYLMILYFSIASNLGKAAATFLDSFHTTNMFKMIFVFLHLRFEVRVYVRCIFICLLYLYVSIYMIWSFYLNEIILLEMMILYFSIAVSSICTR